jgi:hypothetical protein
MKYAGTAPVGVLLDELGEHRFQLRMDRALAAIHQDGNVEQSVHLVEDDVVVGIERIGADGVLPEAGLDVVPVSARADDGHHGGAEFDVGLGGAQRRGQMAVDAVVVVEKAVADEDR